MQSPQYPSSMVSAIWLVPAGPCHTREGGPGRGGGNWPRERGGPAPGSERIGAGWATGVRSLGAVPAGPVRRSAAAQGPNPGRAPGQGDRGTGGQEGEKASAVQVPVLGAPVAGRAWIGHAEHDTAVPTGSGYSTTRGGGTRSKVTGTCQRGGGSPERCAHHAATPPTATTEKPPRSTPPSAGPDPPRARGRSGPGRGRAVAHPRHPVGAGVGAATDPVSSVHHDDGGPLGASPSPPSASSPRCAGRPRATPVRPRRR